MNESNVVFFGRQSLFAIEIAPSGRDKKYYLRFWFNNNSIGAFKKPGSLTEIIKGYFKFSDIIESLHESKFDEMSDIDIFNDIVNVVQRNLPQEEEHVLIERMHKYEFPTGDYQMTDFGVVLTKVGNENNVKFLIYEMNDKKKKPQFYSYTIPVDFFLNTYRDFVNYAHDNNLYEYW